MEQGTSTVNKKTHIVRPQKLRLSEVALFCSQLNFFLHSGIVLDESLDLMRADWNGKRFKNALDDVYKEVDERRPLSKAMALSGAFPAYAVMMTEIGEVSGNLEDVMSFLSQFYQREQKTLEHFKSFFLNTLTLILMMGAVVFLLIIQVLPMFDDLLQSLGGTMPGIIQGFMRFGMFLTNNYVVIIAAALALVGGGIGFFKSKKGTDVSDKLKVSIPFVKTIYGKLLTLRFSSALTLLSAGDVSQETVIDMAKHVLNNGFIAKKLEQCEDEALKHGSVYDAIDEAKLFPERATKMLVFGVKAGNLPSMAQKLSQIYEDEVDKSLNRISTVAETAFITLISIVVAIILVSVILPLVNILSLIG